MPPLELSPQTETTLNLSFAASLLLLSLLLLITITRRLGIYGIGEQLLLIVSLGITFACGISFVHNCIQGNVAWTIGSAILWVWSGVLLKSATQEQINVTSGWNTAITGRNPAAILAAAAEKTE